MILALVYLAVSVVVSLIVAAMLGAAAKEKSDG